MQFDKIVLLWVDLLTLDQKSSVFLSKKSLARESDRAVFSILCLSESIFELSSTGSHGILFITLTLLTIGLYFADDST